MDTLARVFHSREVADALKQATGAPLTGTSLRIEYCQDSDGFWLEPHTDIGVKKFTMLVYLEPGTGKAPTGEPTCTTTANTHFGHAPSAFNAGLIFIPSDKTWHGFEKRPHARRAQVAHHQLRRAGMAQPPRAVFPRGHDTLTKQSP